MEDKDVLAGSCTACSVPLPDASPLTGRDQFPGMNASIDGFIRQGLVENLPITLREPGAVPFLVLSVGRVG